MSSIKRLFSHISLLNTILISLIENSDIAVLSHQNKQSIKIQLINKWSKNSSSELRYYPSSLRRDYIIVYRSRKILSEYTDEDFIIASTKLKLKIKSYINKEEDII